MAIICMMAPLIVSWSPKWPGSPMMAAPLGLGLIMLINRVRLKLHRPKELLSGLIVSQKGLIFSRELILNQRLAQELTIFAPKQSTDKSTTQQSLDSTTQQEPLKASKHQKNLWTQAQLETTSKWMTKMKNPLCLGQVAILSHSMRTYLDRALLYTSIHRISDLLLGDFWRNLLVGHLDLVSTCPKINLNNSMRRNCLSLPLTFHLLQEMISCSIKWC